MLFACCKQKLTDNEHKDSWKDENLQTLVRWLVEEVDELLEACFVLSGSTSGEVLREAADVANISMMIADAMGEFDGATAKREEA